MKVTLNRSLSGLHGRLDDLVYRQQNGQTFAMAFTERPDTPSAAQLARRDRFTEANAYARRVLADPLKRARYRALGAAQKCPANALLISNFLNPPVIDEVEVTQFHGRPGDAIRILATDRIEVKAVRVTLRRADGSVIESGSATRDHDVWVYHCTTAAAGHAPLQIEVAAENRAGAIGKVTLPSAAI